MHALVVVVALPAVLVVNNTFHGVKAWLIAMVVAGFPCLGGERRNERGSMARWLLIEVLSVGGT